MSEMNPEFYVGYQSKAPPGVSRRMRIAVFCIGVLCLGISLLLAWRQGPFAAGRFEFGVYRDYAGELVEWPYPMLLTADARYLLVGPGKFGVADLVRGHDGARGQLRGSLIARGGDRMLEIEPSSLRVADGASARRPTSDLGHVTLIGEIVDTKCHLGVMNPGEGKVHRECAVRCISGGAPPGFLVRDQDGDTRLLLLTGADGRAIGSEVLDYVAEPIRVSGQLRRTGTTLVLLAEPRDFLRNNRASSRDSQPDGLSFANRTRERAPQGNSEPVETRGVTVAGVR